MVGLAVGWAVIARWNRECCTAFHDRKGILVGVAMRDAAVWTTLENEAGVAFRLRKVTVQARPADAFEDPGIR